MRRLALACAGLAGALAAAGDAASRHLLAFDPARAELASTASHYGLLHAVALLGLAALSRQAASGAARWSLAAAAWCFIGGILLFCGGLYLAAAGFPQAVPAVPVGGSLFILGWAAIFVAALALVSKSPPAP